LRHVHEEEIFGDMNGEYIKPNFSSELRLNTETPPNSGEAAE